MWEIQCHFFRLERHFLRSKCMRLPQNAGGLVSLTSELKILILCLGKVLHVLVIQRQKKLFCLLFSNSASKMHSYGKIFPCLTKTSCSWRHGEIFCSYELKFFVDEIQDCDEDDYLGLFKYTLTHLVFQLHYPKMSKRIILKVSN